MRVRVNFLRTVASVLVLFSGALEGQSTTATVQPTVITVSATRVTSGVKKFGLNLGYQSFWDSGLMLKNLVSRNPGFEGEIWQSILHCSNATVTSCTDDNQYSVWPANFFAGATGEWITGGLTGSSVAISSSTAVGSGAGVTVKYSGASQAPAAGDYLVVRANIPGNAQAGWWPSTVNGGTITTELSDLAPDTPGKQAIRLTASGSTQSASLSSYMDTTNGRSFLQLHGSYTLTFRAKGTGGTNALKISFSRVPSSGSPLTYLSQTVALGSTWKDYSYTFNAADTGTVGSLALLFQAAGSSVLLDDVSLSPAASGVVNDTVFRDEVVTMIEKVQPGMLRYMDSGANWGSSIDNLLSPQFARKRAGYSNWNTESDDLPLGLHDFLTLCEQVGAEPWFTMPTGMSTTEMTSLMEYLGGTSSTVYGAKRAAMGHDMPWTMTFPKIHLEFGNEVWNTANPGATMTDAKSYATRMSTIFATARASSWYSASTFDLVGDGWAAMPTWTQTIVSTGTGLDTVDVAPYLFYSFKDASSTEAVFGPMLAQPELLDSTSGGLMQQQASVASSSGKKLAVYEVNLSTNVGSVTQSAINTAVPSLGAGLANIDHMLLLLRDVGVTDQNMFALAGYNSAFTSTNGTTGMTTPLWGSVVDMGNTNLMRPSLLAEGLANSALLPAMLKTAQSGANPTWNQALSSNDNIALTGAHYVQSFAFTDGAKASLILLNLHRTSALPVTLSGAISPIGSVQISQMTAAAITANNETSNSVTVSNSGLTMKAGDSLSLPAYSMTVLSWSLPPVSLTTVSCAASTVSLGATTQCTSDIVAASGASAVVNWTASAGTISSLGLYSAPSVLPASKQVTITATSAQDSSKSASATLALATPGATAITVSCGSSSVVVNTLASCTASVTGVGTFDQSVTWKTSAGTINSSGVFTAPQAVGTAVVTATSATNPAVSGSVTLTIASPSLSISGFQVTNVTSTSITISWNAGISTASSGVSYGATPSMGKTTAWTALLTANPSFTITGLTANTTYYFQPYSTAGGKTVFSSTTVKTSVGGTINPISCATTSVYTLGSDTCTSSMSDGSAITWKASTGSISSAGVYTPPSTLTATTSVLLTATSVNDATQSTTLAISAIPSAVKSVSVSCTPSTLNFAAQSTCAATVTGVGNFSTALNWSTSDGTITAAGLLTAPSKTTNLVVTATSTMSPVVSGTAAVNVTGTAAVNATGTAAVSASATSSGISGLSAKNITSTSATISWSTGVASSSGVDYGTTGSYGFITPWTAALSATPSFVLTGLKPNTLYYVLVWSQANGKTLTMPFTFTTAPS